MIRWLPLILALIMGGCGSSIIPDPLPIPAAAAAVAPPPRAVAPVTGNGLADGVSNAKPADVVAWLLPWLAGLLTIGIVVVVAVAAWLRSRSLAFLAVALACSLVVVIWLKLVLWILGVLCAVAFLGALVYLIREVYQHRRELAKLDPLHCLITRKARKA